MSSRRFACLLLTILAFAVPRAEAQVKPPSQTELLEALTGSLAAPKISDADVSLSAVPTLPRSAAGAKPFTRQQGFEIGIDVMTLLEPADFAAPIWNGRGLAAGDVDRDGYLDIVIGTKQGPRLFINQAGGGFSERELDIPAIKTLGCHVVGLVDINNDGWLDIFLTAFQDGIYYILSDEGAFGNEGLVKAPEHPTMVAQSASFGDVDEDGDLDAVIGNFYLGWAKHLPPVDATNKILFNDKGKFRVVPLDDEIVGDTHSILLSDFNQDGHLDLIVGNDFEPPDFFYYGDGKGGFRRIKKSDGIIPISTDTTMSVDTADYNNDLRLDILMAQIAASGTGAAAQVKTRSLHQYCGDLSRIRERKKCADALKHRMLFKFFSKQQPSDILRCKTIEDKEQRSQCAAMMTWMVVVRGGDETLCDRMPKSQARARFICHGFFKPGDPGTAQQYSESIGIVMNENALLRASADGTFKNVAMAAGVATTGFSWNSKFADFDNDGWQDLYVVNGSWTKKTGTPQKFFFRNMGGERFEEVTDAFGLQNWMMQSAYLMVDFDNDGDLDIIANTISGPVWFYKNNDNKNNSILFELRDQQGNSHCIGCKVRVDHGPPEAVKSQMREIKSGGGYLSFDAPLAHFGLGADSSVTRVEVQWSTGETTTIEGPLPANARYTIERRSGPDTLSMQGDRG